MRLRKKNDRTKIETARENAGQTGDGGMAIFEKSGTLVQIAPPAVNDGIRRLVTRLEAGGTGGVPRLLALTSALSGEGVTYVSRALGAVIANDLGRSVAVVELNWARPAALPDREVGVAQVLTGSATLDEALVGTIVPNLELLSAGVTSLSQRPALARGEALSALIAELGARYEHVVFDLPAVLATSDALTLAGHAEAVSLVVRQGVTAEPQVKRALSELDHLSVLGVIINRWATPVPKRILAALSPWTDAVDSR